MTYTFPPTKFATENTASEQLAHINSELDELIDAHLFKGDKDVVEEALDMIHSIETMLRMYEACGVDIEDMKDHVIAKNRARNYYK